MVFRWSFTFTRKGLEEVFKEVLKTSSGRRLGNVFKKVVTTSILDQPTTSLRLKLRRFYDVIVSAGLIQAAVSLLLHVICLTLKMLGERVKSIFPENLIEIPQVVQGI